MVRKPKPGDSQVPEIYTVSKIVAFASQDARKPYRVRKGDCKAEWLLTREKKKSQILTERGIQRSTSCLEQDHE